MKFFRQLFSAFLIGKGRSSIAIFLGMVLALGHGRPSARPTHRLVRLR